jgi:4-deoxy-L-threo-5-hexosulose-uronate ketol-isomerase
MHSLPDAIRSRSLSTDELRAGFLVQDLFQPGAVTLRHIDLDRVMLGGAVPLEQPLRLDAPESLRAEYFTERREVGILNIGARGTVVVDGERHAMDVRDVVYVGRGAKDVRFESDDANRPARFYILSYPAQASFPTTRVGRDSAQPMELGAPEKANRRRISKYIHADGAQSAQLVMGVTELLGGSVWNTMPSHTHSRRTEVYLYFDIPDDAFVVHLMGEPNETRHIIVRNGEVVLSPHWSIHSGCGTASYTFCWGMGGENRDYTDMQPVEMRNLR